MSQGNIAAIDDAVDIPRLTIEARLIRELKLWDVDPAATVDDGTAVTQEIRSLLEWYICGCIPYGPNALGGWWSDGVIHLEITKRRDGGFKLLGVTWIGCDGLAPFKIDVDLALDDDWYFAKTIFRIGLTDERGLPKLSDSRRNVARVLESRPRSNGDWAMAVELTPPENRDETSR